MKLTAREEYGLRCLLQVARASTCLPGTSITIREVAEAEGLSVENASKLLRVLRQAGLITSRRGASGGYTLSRPASEMTVWDVMNVLDSPLYTTEFCAGHRGKLDSCVHSTSCSIRHLWQWMGSALETVLRRVTVADLLPGSVPVSQILADASVGAPAGTLGEP